jgi:hypothetical protein
VALHETDGTDTGRLSLSTARQVTARWVSSPVLKLIDGPARKGRSVGNGYVMFDDYVLALTPNGAPRMPNGVECSFEIDPAEPVWLGGGGIEVGSLRLSPGPVWNPIPSVVSLKPVGQPCLLQPEFLVGRGEGLTPAGDDILIGYVASLVLIARKTAEATAIAESAARRTTALSATLLRHAAEGQVPEPVHRFLESGDSGDLLAFGHSSGRCILMGLLMGAGVSETPLITSYSASVLAPE